MPLKWLSWVGFYVTLYFGNREFTWTLRQICFGAASSDAIIVSTAKCVNWRQPYKRAKGEIFFISSFIFNANISINGAVNKNKKLSQVTSLSACGTCWMGKISRIRQASDSFCFSPRNFHRLHLTQRRFAVLLSIGFSLIASIFLANLERDTELSFFINISHTHFAKMPYHQRVLVHLTFT